MAIRIDRIKVNRGGPLDSDFELEPGDLNLIYGHNETGKTYIVESAISLLFRTGRRAPVNWNLRGWDLAGRIVVSGLEDNPVFFTRTSSRLEDYWEEASKGLPQDFSRLLVVRAGETSLSGESNGVGRSILKDYLSGEGMLDTIRERISQTIQRASVEHKSIQGDKRGEIKNHLEIRSKLEQLDNLIEDVNRGYATGTIHSLRKDKDQIESELVELKKAKRHYAALLHRDLQTLRSRSSELPGEEKCAEIETQIGVYNEKKANRDSLKEDLKPLKAISNDYFWVEQALQNYQEIMSKQQIVRPSPVFLILAAISFAAAVISGFIDLKWGLGVGALAALVFSWLHLSGRSKVQESVAGDSDELEKLKSEFQNRFGKTLTDKAAIQNQLEALKRDHFRAGQLHENLAKLNQEMISVDGKIAGALQEYTNKRFTPDNWQKEVANLRARRVSLENQIRDMENKIASLDVPLDQCLDDDPGITWDSDRFSFLEKEIENIQDKIDVEIGELDSLKSRVAQETNGNSTEKWEDLLTALHEKRESAVREYREITAEILGKIQVYTALQEFREQETERIKNGLAQQPLTEPLFTITGRYNRIDLDDDDLILSDQNDNSFSLANMSTGVREQVFLALRLGFASIGMKGETAFLILDDAFQHSDWLRRNNLIDQTLSLVKTGWQVFYFTMDDHIRDLFLKAGEKMGDGFTSLELC